MYRFFAFIFILSFLFSCKKDNEYKPDFSTPEAVCEAPDPVDMSDATHWGDGTPGSCTQESLQALINSGGKIICDCGGDFTLKLTETLVVPNKEVIIDGNDQLTIDGNGSHRIFDLQSAASLENGTLFAIQNMNLINGKASLNSNERGGAAIYGRAHGSLRVINVNFENNKGPFNVSDDCGAVHTIVYEEVLFANCNFIGNQGANGAAVGTIGSAMTFINCNFENNSAIGSTGDKKTGGCGGAIYVDGVNQNGSANKFISICGCTFDGNSAGYQAGALNIIFYQGTGSYLSLDKCTFNNNSCDEDKGGACYFMNGEFSVQNSTFSENSSPAQGGAIWGTNLEASLINCTFWANDAVEGSDGLGGAVTFGGTSSKITNCTFVENRAGNFASAIFNGGNMTLTNNLFYNNKVGNGFQSNPYGGAVINKGSNLTVRDGNLQFPTDFTGQYGTSQDYWITENVITEDPKVEALADNGGPTHTMALPSGSVAIGKGTKDGAPTLDQRGQTRKNPPDIGAYESQ